MKLMDVLEVFVKLINNKNFYFFLIKNNYKIIINIFLHLYYFS